MNASRRHFVTWIMVDLNGVIAADGSSDVDYEEPTRPPTTNDEIVALANRLRARIDLHRDTNIVVTSVTPC